MQLWIIQKELKGGGTVGEERCEVAQSETSVRPNTGNVGRNVKHVNDHFDLVSNTSKHASSRNAAARWCKCR